MRVLRRMWELWGNRRRQEEQAQERARRLLQECLTPAQWDDYVRYRHFTVRGNVTGRLYRIHNSTMTNVEPLDPDGSSAGHRLCFFPTGGLPLCDVLVGQMLALQGMEDKVLGIANRQIDLRVRTGAGDRDRREAEPLARNQVQSCQIRTPFGGKVQVLLRRAPGSSG